MRKNPEILNKKYKKTKYLVKKSSQYFFFWEGWVKVIYKFVNKKEKVIKLWQRRNFRFNYKRNKSLKNNN